MTAHQTSSFAKTTDGQGKSETTQREETILEFWKERDIFKKSIDKAAPKGEFVFYDGPLMGVGC